MSLIEIVYFANLFVNRPHGHDLIKEQLTDLVITGLLDQGATLHIVLSVPRDYNYIGLQSTLSRLFRKNHRVFPNIIHENCHEYPGIQMVYRLAQQNPLRSHYILYFHSKSMTRFKGKREHIERALHSTVIVPWRKVLEIFQNNPSIDKIGSSCSNHGWIWWNYWWVRASYIVHMENPIKTDRRHYYEEWLSRQLHNPSAQPTDPHRPEERLTNPIYKLSNKNCWGLSNHANPIGSGCDPHGAIAALLKRKKR